MLGNLAKNITEKPGAHRAGMHCHPGMQQLLSHARAQRSWLVMLFSMRR